MPGQLISKFFGYFIRYEYCRVNPKKNQINHTYSFIHYKKTVKIMTIILEKNIFSLVDNLQF